MKIKEYLLIILFVVSGYSYAEDPEIANCNANSSCVIKIFRNDAPDLLNQHTVSLNPPLPIDNSNIVNINVDGTATAVTCNGSWQSLVSVSGNPELQNRIKCTVESNRTSITADIRLYDQTSFQKIYNTEPAVSGFANLDGTSEISPYCVNQATPENALACQWEEAQNNDTWVIVSRTEAYALLIGAIEGDPGYDGGGTPTEGSVCADQAGNWGQCVITDNKADPLCLVDAVACTATNSDPICSDGGVLDTDTALCEKPPESITCLNDFYTYNAQFDKCERPPYCPDGGVFNPNTLKCEITVAGMCPEGFTFDEQTDSCNKTPGCEGSGIYDPDTDMCVTTVNQECENNAFLNPSGYCEKDPCENGGIYNAGAKVCTESATLTCPEGYQAQGDLCVKAPLCLSGGSYNAVTDRCEAPNPLVIGTCITINDCPSGQYFAHVRALKKGLAATCKEEVISYSGDQGETIAPLIILGNISGVFYKAFLIGKDENVLNLNNIIAQKKERKITVDPFSDHCTEIETYIEKICEKNYECHVNNTVQGSYSDIDQCNSSCSITEECPAGYTENAGLCTANPSCENGGTFNPNTDQCEIQIIKECPEGSVYDIALDKCTRPACSNGYVLNPNTNLCERASIKTCPINYTLTGMVCTSSAVCGEGSVYNPNLDLCQIPIAGSCPQSYTYNPQNNLCVMDYACFNGSVYSDATQTCILDANHTCAASYSYNPNSKMCEAIPICQAGAFDPDTLKCYEGENTCPYGPQFPCLAYQGKNMCSSLNCAEVAGNETVTDTVTGADDKQNDAPIDANGVCQGNIYFFNGKDSRCRSWGINLVMSGCCNKDTYLMGTLDCKEDEKILSKQKGNGLCHYVGEYDSKHINVGFTKIATEKKKTYCCFNSKLARIIHEQGRPQLIEFSQEGWGTPKNPVCRGFSPEEFQMLDFQKIDLKEYAADIKTKSTEGINTGIKNTLDGKQGNFKPLNVQP